MQKPTRFVGLDVHKDLIAVAVCEAGTEPSYLGTIPNEPEAVSRLMRKLGAPDTLQVCYKAAHALRRASTSCSAGSSIRMR